MSYTTKEQYCGEPNLNYSAAQSKLYAWITEPNISITLQLKTDSYRFYFQFCTMQILNINAPICTFIILLKHNPYNING